MQTQTTLQAVEIPRFVDSQDDLSSNFPKLWLRLDTGKVTASCNTAWAVETNLDQACPAGPATTVPRGSEQEKTISLTRCLLLCPQFGLVFAELCRAKHISSCLRAVGVNSLNRSMHSPSQRQTGEQADQGRKRRQRPVLYLLLSYPRGPVRSPKMLKICYIPVGAQAEPPLLKEQERLGIFAASHESLLTLICSVTIVWALFPSNNFLIII